MNSNGKLTKKQIERMANKFLSCRTLKEVEQLLRLKPNTISLHAFDPLYYHFTIPKANGKLRSIEAPDDSLKRVQRRLNKYLQCIYYTIQTNACYGYMISAIAEKRPKNIYTNAAEHIGSTYLLNVDFENFFHQIKQKSIEDFFNKQPFNLERYAARVIARLCTYKGRLPMGTPTSPVLSNFYTIQPDIELQKWANKNEITYTRFVDDLTFSSIQKEVGMDSITSISKIVKNFNLILNPEKQKFFGPTDLKKVTGLLVGQSVNIDPEFYCELDADILRLQKIVEVNQITGLVNGLAFLKRFKQEIYGKINFVKQIAGKNSDEYVHYVNAFHDAIEPKEQFVARWTKFNNYT